MAAGRLAKSCRHVGDARYIGAEPARRNVNLSPNYGFTAFSFR